MLFNSLGSNYSFKFVFNSLFSSAESSDKKKLESYLTKRYGGKAILLYKGREAIKLAFDLLNLPKGSRVGINGFTCYAVYKAIKDAECIPEYLDIGGRDLNFSLDDLSKEINYLKAVIVQNTLGNPCNIGGVKTFCQNNNIFLIEDLAHSVGTKYKDGKEAGSYGDFVALSFSQDKMVDAVSGGALIIKNKDFVKSEIEKLKNINVSNKIRDRFYPFLTFLIRRLYPVKVGKILHYLLRKLNFLSQPISVEETTVCHNLPNWYCQLSMLVFDNLSQLLNHRRKIASIYAEGLDPSFLSKSYVESITHSSCVRFPIFVKDRLGLIKYLGKNGIFVSDIWYDAPIAPKRFLGRTDYSGQCPVSEKISKEIVNLPTHINISINQAKYISDKINIWQKSHQEK